MNQNNQNWTKRDVKPKTRRNGSPFISEFESKDQLELFKRGLGTDHSGK
jgi:hypothetical protein